jgi:HPt (histidine-containing phosphotransfer) domain-containing protein
VTGDPIDEQTVEGLATSFGGGADGWAFVRDLIGTFLEETPGELEALGQAIDESRAEDARRIAHTMKTHGATFGASAFTEACRELEAVAKGGLPNDAAASLLDRAKLEWQRAGEALERLAAQGAA